MTQQPAPLAAPQSARRLLIVWWSVTGASRAMALAAHRAACDAQECEVQACEVHLRQAGEASVDDLLQAHAFLFVMPEMLGSMAGAMKDLFDRTYYPLLGRLEGRPYALVVCAGSDGSGAVRQLERIVTGWRLRRVAEPLIVCTHAQTPEAIAAPKVMTPEALEAAAVLGQSLATGVALGIW